MHRILEKVKDSSIRREKFHGLWQKLSVLAVPLIRAADEASCDITIFGQEKDNATAGLARMNLVLHNKGAGEIAKGSTISSPKYKNENNAELLKTFDYIVVNPPFSDKSWMEL